MISDFWIVLQWWGTLFLVGAVAWPLTKVLFGQSNQSWEHYTMDPRVRGDDKIKDGVASRSLGEGWFDHGYLFSKAVGMASVSWIVYVMGTTRVMPFSVWSIGVALGVVFLFGLLLNIINQQSRHIVTPAHAGVQSKTTLFNFTLDPRVRGDDKKVAILFLEEIFFLAAILAWSWVKAHEPSIRGLEKFMDYGFMRSILNSSYFPPADMWYAPLPINYYYFGHMVTAMLTKLSGLDLAVTFNLMLATIFALTMTMSFSIGYQLIFICHSREGGNPVLLKKKDGSPIRSGMTRIFSGLLTAFLVTLAGNMQTIYAFTRGYTGENVKPFWELGWNIRELWGVGGVGEILGKIGEGMNTYWYANATRFIPFTIHEFPSYSFVVSDVHGHVLSIPFVLLAVALLIRLFDQSFEARDSLTKRIGRPNTIFLQESLAFAPFIFYGFLVGILLMTNALDGPIYFALAVLVLVIIQLSNNPIIKLSNIKQIGVGVVIIAGAAILTSLPFLVHFKSFVTGVAVNCPPSFLATMKFGPILFEGVEKCQRSPLWMWWLLWGFFVYCGMGLIYKNVKRKKEKGKSETPCIDSLLIVFFAFALVLVIVPEFIYFKDIYPMHFRSNTMFKLGYEAFILFSIVAGYTIVSFSMSFPRKRESIFLGLDPRLRGDDKKGSGDDNRARYGRILFLLFLLPQLILVSIYPMFSVRSYFGGLKRYEGIDGLGWLRREYPGDWEAIKWLRGQVSSIKYLGKNTKEIVLVEADGDSYTDYARFSAFTGNPTIIGWSVHEWLWRGTYDVVAPRREEVRQIYESQDVEVTSAILDKYEVRYVIVGKLEREKYKSLQEWKFLEVGREVFRAGGTIIYEMK